MYSFPTFSILLVGKGGGREYLYEHLVYFVYFEYTWEIQRGRKWIGLERTLDTFFNKISVCLVCVPFWGREEGQLRTTWGERKGNYEPLGERKGSNLERGRATTWIERKGNHLERGRATTNHLEERKGNHLHTRLRHFFQRNLCLSCLEREGLGIRSYLVSKQLCQTI